MSEEQGRPSASSAIAKRMPGNLGAFLIVFLFVWIVFDSLALGFLFALMAGGGTEAAQRAAGSKTGDRNPD